MTFEVFDYLVDVMEERAASPDRTQRYAAVIPIETYRLVVERASRAERPDVEIAARTQFRFIGRNRELAELTSWLAGPLGSTPPLGVLHGMGGIGKSAILRRLQELADPRTRELIAKDPAQPLINVPQFDLVLSAQGRTGSQLLAAICGAAGLKPVPTETDTMRAMRLHEALRGQRRPMLIAIDGLDEAADPEQAMHALLELYRTDDNLPLRILVATRQQPPLELNLVRAVEVSAGTRQDVVQSVRDRLVAARGSASPELTDQTARVIADFADGLFLAANMIVGLVISGSLPTDPAALAQELRKIPTAQSPPGATVRHVLEGWLDSLGDRTPDVRLLMTALALGPAQGTTAEEWLAAASRLGNRSYSKADLDSLERVGVVGRPRDSGTYRLHDLTRAFVLGYQDHGTWLPPSEGARE